MNLKFVPPIIVLIGEVGFMVWFFASGLHCQVAEETFGLVPKV